MRAAAKCKSDAIRTPNLEETKNRLMLLTLSRSSDLRPFREGKAFGSETHFGVVEFVHFDHEEAV